MTTIQPNFIAVTPDRKNLVGCHNLSSARAYASGRLPNKVDEPTSFSYKCKAFVAPSGQFYVNIFAGSQVIRMDVANAQTARYYVKNGVDCELATSIFMETELPALFQSQLWNDYCSEAFQTTTSR